jgi:hypothetical protein
MRRLSILAAFFLATATAFAGGSKELTVPAGFIELRNDVEVDAISWVPLQPYTLPYRTYENGRAFVTYATGGQFVVLVTTVDLEKKPPIDQSTWTVKVQGTVPTPPPLPPDPNVPPVPTPVDPLPNTVPNYYGVGATAYNEAVRIGRPAEAAAISQEFQTAYMNLHMGKWLPNHAAEHVNQAVLRLPAYWRPWIQAVSAALTAARAKHGAGITMQRDMLREVSDALNIAAKATPPTKLSSKPRPIKPQPIWAVSP